MNDIELSILIGGIIFFAIINYYFCFDKEEQINNKSISLYNKAKKQKSELVKEKLSDRTVINFIDDNNKTVKKVCY